MKKLIVLIITIFLFSTAVLADRVILKNGRTITGRATVQGTIVIVKGQNTEVRFLVSDVERIITGDDPGDEYAARARCVPFNDKAAHLALADWCGKQELEKEEKFHLFQALRITPEDAVLRRRLGFTFYNGRWLSKSGLMRARGLVSWGDEWVTPEEKAKRVAEAKRLAQEKKLLREKDKAERAKARKEAARMEQALARTRRDIKNAAARRVGRSADYSGLLPRWWRVLYHAWKRRYPQFFGGRQR